MTANRGAKSAPDEATSYLGSYFRNALEPLKHTIRSPQLLPNMTIENRPAPDDLPVRKIKLTPEGINQADVDAVGKRLTQMRKRLREDILFIGGKLAKMRDKIPHGRWGRFIAQTFTDAYGLSLKTSNIWIRAWENRNSELALADWAAYMRDLYGNEPKKLKADYKAEPEEKDPDDEQSGGDGFGPGLGEPTIFADKGKPGFYSFKQITAMLDREFFESKSVTLEAKTQFASELISWLEARKKNLRALQEGR